MRTLLLVIAVLAGTACKKEPAKSGPTGDKTTATDPKPENAAGSPVDLSGLVQQMRFASRADRILARPDVDKAFDQVINAVFEDPALAKIGEDLMSKIGSDAAVARGAEAITSTIAENPNVIRRLQQMMRDRPDLTPDQLGEAFGEEFSKTFDLILAKPVEHAAQRALQSLDIGKEKALLLGQLGAKLDASVEAYIADPARVQKWSARLTELNGGTPPSAAKAGELFEQHALEEERVAKYVIAVLADPATRTELTNFLRKVVMTKTVEDAMITAARDLVSDPVIQRHAAATMAVALDPKASPGEATKQVDALFDSPALRAGLTTVVRAFMTEPSVATSIDESLRAVWAAPSVRTATEAMLDGW